MNGGLESYALATLVRTRQRLIDGYSFRSFTASRQHRIFFDDSSLRIPKHLVQYLDVLVQIVKVPEGLLAMSALVTLNIVVDEGSV